jgi:acyl transferase domain-containing protein
MLTGFPSIGQALIKITVYRRIPLPTYPFERQRYWIDPPENSDKISTNSSVAVNKIVPRPKFSQ